MECIARWLVSPTYSDIIKDRLRTKQSTTAGRGSNGFEIMAAAHLLPYPGDQVDVSIGSPCCCVNARRRSATRSALNASIWSLSSVSRRFISLDHSHKPASSDLLGVTSSILSGTRLNGSLGSLKR